MNALLALFLAAGELAGIVLFVVLVIGFFLTFSCDRFLDR